MEILNEILRFITENMMASAGMVSLFLEAIFRFLPSEKPKSIMYLVADIFNASGKILTAAGQFLDAIVGQRLK